MTTIHPSTSDLDRRPRSRASARSSPRSSGPSLTARGAALAVALPCAVAGIVVASAYPVAPLVVLALFVAWTAFAFARLSLALPAVLALLPVVGFAPVTGWFAFEETDLLILASLAGGYAALAVRAGPTDTDDGRHRPTLSIFSIALLALFLVSIVIALQRGIAAAGGFRFDWADGYGDPQNSLRIFKSFAWMLLTAPLLLRELRRPGGFDRIGLGFVAALGLETLAVLQERIAFTGLLDFTDDYRVTGSFWEMHVGGAALDGFLALTIPFAVREAVRHASRARLIGAWVVLALAAYACLVTFSRGVYAAVPVSLLLLVVLVFRQRLRLDRSALWSVLGKGALFAVLVATAGFFVFRAGGYRAVLATFLLLAAAIPVAASIRRIGIAGWVPAAIGAAMLGAVSWLAGDIVPKGPYLIFVVAIAAVAVAVFVAERDGTRTASIAAVAAWLWLAACAVLVARHWGGMRAFADSAVVVTVLVALALAGSRLATSPWPAKRSEQLATIGFAALVMGAIAVFTAGAYMGGRFASSRSDLDIRLAHWTEGIGRLHTADDWLFGKGLGRFPATSQFESPDAIAPGSYRIATRDGDHFLALTGPRLKYLGWDELFRVSQRVSVRPNTTYMITIRARSAQQSAMHVEVCEKQLLYHGTCLGTDPGIPAGLGAWQLVTFPLKTGAIGGSSWFAPRPVFFAIANGNPGAVLEVRDIRMVGPDGVDVIANGDFGARTARWFSSSDKWHLPWHIKNIVLDVLFDQGVVGLALFALLVGAALLRTALGRAFRHPDAPYVAAAIAGYLVVGAFDSLLDVPRVAYAFYLVVIVGLMLRNPRVASTADDVRVPPAPRAAPPPEPQDAAAERAKRRQKAFGERVPSPR